MSRTRSGTVMVAMLSIAGSFAQAAVAQEVLKGDANSRTVADTPDPDVDRVANLLASMPVWNSVDPPKTVPLDEILAYVKKISTASTATIRKAELLYLQRLPKGTFNDDLLNKFFVLHRYIFNVPVWAQFHTVPFFGGFAGVPTTHDSFNSLWPFSYDKNKQLILTGQFRGYYGAPYMWTDEFDFFSKTFGRRQKFGNDK